MKPFSIGNILSSPITTGFGIATAALGILVFMGGDIIDGTELIATALIGNGVAFMFARDNHVSSESINKPTDKPTHERSKK